MQLLKVNRHMFLSNCSALFAFVWHIAFNQPFCILFYISGTHHTSLFIWHDVV